MEVRACDMMTVSSGNGNGANRGWYGNGIRRDGGGDVGARAVRCDVRPILTCIVGGMDRWKGRLEGS